MTDEQKTGPLWSDERIGDRVVGLYKAYRNTPPKVVMYEELLKMRDEYQAALTAANARVAELERDCDALADALIASVGFEASDEQLNIVEQILLAEQRQKAKGA
jgi:hypothetical protein